MMKTRKSIQRLYGVNLSEMRDEASADLQEAINNRIDVQKAAKSLRESGLKNGMIFDLLYCLELQCGRQAELQNNWIAAIEYALVDSRAMFSPEFQTAAQEMHDCDGVYGEPKEHADALIKLVSECLEKGIDVP